MNYDFYNIDTPSIKVKLLWIHIPASGGEGGAGAVAGATHCRIPVVGGQVLVRWCRWCSKLWWIPS